MDGGENPKRSWQSSAKWTRVSAEVDTVEEQVALDGRVDGGGEGALGALAGGTETTESTRAMGVIRQDSDLESPTRAYRCADHRQGQSQGPATCRP